MASAESLQALRCRIEANVVRVPFSGCWIWMLSLDTYGYGRSSLDGKRISAHRGAFLTFKGPIPDGAVVCHTCDVPCCANPDHLFIGTQKENQEDMVRKGRSMYGLRAPSTKLTPEIARAVYCSSLSQPVLARAYGVSAFAIWAIKNGRTWRRATQGAA